MTETGLQIEAEVYDDLGVVVVTPNGMVDASTFNQLEKKLTDLFKKGHHKIIIDLGGVDYISSAGVGVFFASVYEAREAKGDIVLLNLSEQVCKVFEILNISKLLNIASDINEALDFFEKGKKRKK